MASDDSLYTYIQRRYVISLEEVQALIANGSDPNYVHPTTGFTPLLLLCRPDYQNHTNALRVIRYLLHLPNIQLNIHTDRMTLLHHMTLVPNSAFLYMLLKEDVDYNGDINALCFRGLTALHMACDRRSRIPIENIQYLLDAGADCNIQDPDGLTPLHTLLIHGANNNDTVPIMNMLLRYSVDLSIRDRAGNTALHLAIRLNNENICTILLKGGANPGDINAQGESGTLMAEDFPEAHEAIQRSLKAKWTAYSMITHGRLGQGALGHSLHPEVQDLIMHSMHA